MKKDIVKFRMYKNALNRSKTDILSRIKKQFQARNSEAVFRQGYPYLEFET